MLDDKASMMKPFPGRMNILVPVCGGLGRGRMPMRWMLWKTMQAAQSSIQKEIGNKNVFIGGMRNENLDSERVENYLLISMPIYR